MYQNLKVTYKTINNELKTINIIWDPLTPIYLINTVIEDCDEIIKIKK